MRTDVRTTAEEVMIGGMSEHGSEGSGRSRFQSCAIWLVLLVVSGGPRIVGAFLLPNEEGDPYSYVEAIESLRASLTAGVFSIGDLFGFWFPLYQFVCAVIASVVGHPLYVAKLVSALCGIGVCVLVYVISLQLTANRTVSLLAGLLIAINPTHIMYSVFSMTDVPHAFLVMLSLYFTLRKRWVLAAVFVAAGSLTRIESWMFVLLLPALQYLVQRKVSKTACVIALSAPLFWLYISWSATGNGLEYFRMRSEYIAEFLVANPHTASFSWPRTAATMYTLCLIGNVAVVMAAIVGAFTVGGRRGRNGVWRIPESLFPAVAVLVYFFSSLGFLLFAFFTGSQPEVWPRYGLILFALGIPILAWTFLAIKATRPEWTRIAVAVIAVACCWQIVDELRGGVRFVGEVVEKHRIANYLKARYEDNRDVSIYCEDFTVRVLSGIPAAGFWYVANSPDEPGPLLAHLKEQQVEYFVYSRRAPSPAVTLFKQLGEQTDERIFRLVMAPETDYASDLRLYRINSDGLNGALDESVR